MKFSAPRTFRDARLITVSVILLLISAFLLNDWRDGAASAGGSSGAAVSSATTAAPVASFTVNSTADPGTGGCDVTECTLREAITAANAAPGADTITFNIPDTDAGCAGGVCTISLTGALPSLSSGLTIQGPGANALTISGNNASRVFEVGDGSTVSISGLTISNGQATGANGSNGGDGAPGQGGAILNAGNLTLTGVTLSNNTARGGDGAASEDGAGGAGGAGQGGAIYNSGTLTLSGSTLKNNVATGGAGGGGAGAAIYNSGTLTISNATLTANTVQEGPATFTTSFGEHGSVRHTAYVPREDILEYNFSDDPEIYFGSSHVSDHDPAIDFMTLYMVTTEGAFTFRGEREDIECPHPPPGSRQPTVLIARRSLEIRASPSLAPCILQGVYWIAPNGPDTELPASRIRASTYVGDGWDGTLDEQNLVSVSQLDLEYFDGPRPPVNNTPNSLVAGGAVFNQGGAVSVTNSTFSANAAKRGFGGALYNLNGQTDITSSTFADNVASVTGGSLYNLARPGGDGVTAAPATLTLANSILGNLSERAQVANRQLAGADAATVNLAGPNLSATNVFNVGGQVTGSASVVTADELKLGPLAANGGPTQTHALLAGSVAIDQGRSFGLTTDQRGFTRPSDFAALPNAEGGDGSDIGAFEVQPPPNTAPTATASPSPAVTDEDTPVLITLTGTDADDHNLTFAITQQPTNGTLSAIATPDCSGVNTCTATVTYTPNADYNGADSFKFKVNDGTVDSAEVTVTLNISAVDDTAYVVTKTADTNDGACAADCSLREAIAAANADAGTETITFDIPGAGPHTIQLTTALPALSDSVNILNTSGESITVRGEGAADPYRIFTINSGQTVNISGLIISNGNANDGGGLFNSGTLTLTNSTVSGNTAGNIGGGIRNTGTLTLENITVSGSTAHFGGGIASCGPLNMTNSTVSGNTSSFGAGGIANDCAGNALTLTNSTVSGNTAGFGGGITNFIGTVTLTNSTVSGNTATSNGGGINNSGGALNLTSVTITNNRAGGGGGLYINTGTPLLRNTIVADNYRGAGTATEDDISGGSVNAASSFNLIGTGGAGGLNNGTNNNQVGVADPRLAPLAHNGGPTQTHLLLPGSPAIDAGHAFALTTLSAAITAAQTTFDVADSSAISAGAGFTILVDSEQMVVVSKAGNTLTVTRGANGTTAAAHASGASLSPAFDQRGAGFPRLVNTTADIGAVEVNYSISATAGTPQSTLVGTAFATQLQATVTESGTPQSGLSVTFTAPVSGASGVFQGSDNTATVLTNSSGVATAPTFTANGTTGSYNVVASLVGQPTVNFALTNTSPGTIQFSSATYSVAENLGFATITVTRTGGSLGSVSVTFNTSDGTATATGQSDYTAITNQTVTFSDGDTAPKTIQIAITNDAVNEPDETVNMALANPTGGATLSSPSSAVLTILNDDTPTLDFTPSIYTVEEDSTQVIVTVSRTGDPNIPVTVDYQTSDVSASQRSDYIFAAGTLRFAAGEAAQSFNVLINEDALTEGTEAFQITLTNATGGGAVIGPAAMAIISITDDSPETTTNPIDDPELFVRQQYHDFLNREPDAAGLAFWTSEITACQQITNAQQRALCIEDKRNNVSAAFFLSIEFQQTGFLAYRFYLASLPETAQRPRAFPRFAEFMRDTQALQREVIFGQPGANEQLEANTVAFSQEWVQRAEFSALYPVTLTAEQYVDALYATSSLVPTTAERDAALAAYGSGGVAGRAAALRSIADSQTLKDREFRRAFVLMEYFGYLRRSPDELPDTNFSGYDFWLGKLNDHNGNFITSQMVLAFINSGEYRNRFGQ